MGRKRNLDALVQRASTSIKQVLEDSSTGAFEMEELNYLIRKYSLLNEAEYYAEMQEPAGIDTRQRYVESTEMYKLVLELFLMELEKFKKGLAKSK